MITKKYLVLSGGSPEELEREVNRFLADGYQLAGGVCAYKLDDDYEFLQAVYR